MNRLQRVSSSDQRANRFESAEAYQAENSLRWVQLICEQLGDGYIVFSQWQCLGLGGVMWRDAGSGRLFRAKNEEWLSFFHEEDQGIVALGLADPMTNTFPPVRVFDRRDHAFKRARMRLFHPPFESVEGLFVVILQLDATSPEKVADPIGKSDAQCEIFKATSAEMLVINIRSGRIENANQAFLKHNHLEGSEAIGEHFGQLPVIDADVAGVILGTIELGGRIRRRPIVLTPAQQEPREMLLDINAIEGKEDLYVLHFVDVTVHNSATRHLSSILNNLPVGVFTKDPHDGTYLLSNVAADSFFHRSKPLRGQHDADIFPPETSEAFAEVDRMVAKEGRAIEVQEFPVRMPNAETRLFDILRAPIRDARGQISRILGMVREVTDDVHARNSLTRARDEADRANRAKDEFLVNMGHEIRTPMNAILGFSKLLAETELDEDQIDLNEEVRTSGENLSAIIDSILDLSQISGGSLELEIQEFDMEGLCEELIEMLQPEARKKDLDLHLIFDPHTPARVSGDPLRLRQIMSHVVGNAIKFTETGRIELWVSGSVAPNGRASIGFSVCDSGIGIPASKLHSIFDPFVQADSSETRSYEGTGLGLTLSQKLAEAMGSRITVKSELGHGSVFEFRLEFDYEGSGSLLEIENPAPPITLHILDKDRRGGEHVAIPIEHWGMKTIVANSPDDLNAVVETVKRGGCAYVNWRSLSLNHRERLPGLIRSTRFPGRWIISMAESEAQETFLELASMLQLIEPNPRTSHLRMAVLEAAAAEEVDADALESHRPGVSPVSLPERPQDPQPALRALIIDDDGMHRRVLGQLLQGREIVVDTCGAEHDAYVLCSIHAYDLVFFESSFVGIDTPRMLIGIRRSAGSTKMPQFVGLAFTINEGREAALRQLGVRAFLSKPIEANALDACLRALS